MKVQLARSKDIETLAELHLKLFDDELPPITPQSQCWLAFDEDKKPVGFCMARKLRWENAVFLERAGVLPIAKGLGLQRRMVRVRERWAQEVGASCCLTYAIYSNYPSIINLLRCGYRFYRPQTKWGADRSHYFRRDF